jgi:hypothetical protein
MVHPLRRNRGTGASWAAKAAACGAVAITAAAASASFLPLAASAAPAKSHPVVTTVKGFSGIASTRSLVLDLFGTTITGGFSSAGINDGVAAASEAEGLLTPGLTSVSRANALQGEHTGANTSHCASPSVPSQVAALLSISAACSQASSYSTKSGDAGASGSASVLTISVNLLGLLLHNQIPGLPGLGSIPGLGSLGKGAGLGSLPGLGSLGKGLPSLPKLPGLGSVGGLGSLTGGAKSKGGSSGSSPLSPILSALQSVFGPLPKIPVAGISLSALINEITHSQATQLLKVVLGASQSSTSTSDGMGSAASSGGAVEIELLPGAGQGGRPLLDVEVGAASVKSVIGSTGHSYAVDNPSLISITLSSPLGTKVINLAPGQSQTLLAGTPLASTIAAGYGTTATAPDGTESSGAQAVTLDLLQGVQGGIGVTLASPDASATPPATSAHTSPVPTKTPPTHTAPTPSQGATPVPSATSPHTGLVWAGAMPYLLGAGLFGMALLALPKTRRLARLLRRTHS